jgi:hypothetical protein
MIGIMGFRKLFQFPDPVNEVAARSVATGVVVLVILAELTWNRLLLGIIAFGFLARVLSGPRFSPLGRIATHLVADRLITGGRRVPGPPKRFAQGIGAVFSAATLLLTLTHHSGPARVVLGVLGVFAFLEASVGFCAGCKAYGVLQRLHLVPEVCEDCSDLRLRRTPARALAPSTQASSLRH